MITLSVEDFKLSHVSTLVAKLEYLWFEVSALCLVGSAGCSLL